MKKITLFVFLFMPLAVLAQLPFTITGTGFNNGDKIFMVNNSIIDSPLLQGMFLV